MPYSLSWQSTGLQNRLSQVRVLHQVAALEKGYALEWKASGLTQRELAEKLGVITGTIGYYERGAGQIKAVEYVEDLVLTGRYKKCPTSGLGAKDA